MTTTLVVRFPWGRFHATPWGRHVNEGLVEFPPSPWRLLRALYSVWQLRLPDIDEATAHALFGRLAEPPVYFLPRFRLSHTRHYYPDSKHRSGMPSTDRTLDAFAVLDPKAGLAVQWSFDLDGEEHKTLDRLSRSLPYLGRADSLCEAELVTDWQPSSGQRIAPLDLDERDGADVDSIDLLAPSLPLDVTALVARPVDVRAKKLLFPPGSRFVPYERPVADVPRNVPRRRRTPPVTAVRFTVTAPALPPLTDAVYLTDRLRRAALSKLGRLRGGKTAEGVLAGKAADGQPLLGHGHAHYLALPNDTHRLEELVVWTPQGLPDDEMLALSRVIRLWGAEDAPGPGTVEVRLSAYGDADSVLSDLAKPARAWRSVTPFVPPRHCKGEWVEFVAAEVRRELTFRALPEPTSFRLVDSADWRMFMRRRPHDGKARARGAARLPAGVQIEFADPIGGPLALGALSHFGLGLFVPM